MYERDLPGEEHDVLSRLHRNERTVYGMLEGLDGYVYSVHEISIFTGMSSSIVRAISKSIDEKLAK